VRVAIVSDIHGNRTAFEAVLADLRDVAPDLVLHGGDLADAGSSPVEIVDRVHDLGWPGVIGNTDEMLAEPETFEEFARESAGPGELWSAIREMAAWTRDKLGRDRLAWLRALPRVQSHDDVALVHASPETLWRAPSAAAGVADLRRIYGPLNLPHIVYGHTHEPYVRSMPGLTIANSGSAGLPYDGDPRAAYIVIDGSEVAIRRVQYDVGKETAALRHCGLPRAEWVARMLTAARPLTP
jgi:predicted phosphodiesterase